MGHITLVIAAYLSQIHYYSFDRKSPCYWQNLIFYNYFLLHNKLKKAGHVHFYKNCTDCKKGAMKVTCTMFLSREVEQLVVYQLLPNFTIWEDFVWDDCFLAVNQWACLYDIPTKFRIFVTKIFRVIISIDLITTLGSVGCYILLLPACKGEM